MSKAAEQEKLLFKLFVAGEEPNSVIAKKKLYELCDEIPEEEREILIIDVYQDYSVALEEGIVITPTLIASRSDKQDRMVFFGNLQKSNQIEYYMKKGRKKL
ncbi:MAG: circadian clock KaiB family protein [Spirochaetia bacterium]